MSKTIATKQPRGVMEFKLQPIRTWTNDSGPLDDSAKVTAFWREHIMPADSTRLDRMCLWVVCLDTRRRVIGYELVAIGNIDTVPIHPREVFRPALAAGASEVVVVSNNPSGDPTPGDGVIQCAPGFVRAGKLMKIEVVDVVVVVSDARPVSERNYCSLRELDYLESASERAAVRIKPAKRARFQWN